MSEQQDTETGGDPLLETAWVVIANASGWDDPDRKEWREAARRWRDDYFSTLRSPAPTVADPPTQP